MLDHVVRDVTASGVRMRVLEAGADTSPALVLIHDFLTSRLAFEDIIGPLSTRFHVLAPDLPGFGESEKPSAARYAYGIEAFAEAIADLIAAFGVGRAHLCGHSLGGAVAITLAAEHPELVQRLVVEDSLCYPFPMGMRRKLPLVPVIGGIFFKQLWGRALFRSFFRDEIYGRHATFPAARVERHYELFNGPSARESAHAVLRAGLDARPVVARLTRIATPTLVVWGRDDRLFPAVSAQRLAREIPGARLEIMDAGHSPHEERPREFVALLTQFLEGRR
ncbi:alpha/beta fold hydrolase [Chondromyces crocatus]|uniref:alpha/beta fold hydrolase n=1 Tax=Chondromyces crocatus TaxID=52 RepID=UPI001FDFB4B2|nr:alpha/beta hydrolase [Chondromyces crocatus]